MNDFERPKSRVYVLADAAGRVLRLEGERSLPADLVSWVKIDEGYGDRYALAQSHYLPYPLFTTDGLYRYKLVDGVVVERSEDELKADRAARPAPPPTTDEILLELAADHEARLCEIELGV